MRRGGELFLPEARQLAVIETGNLLRERPQFFPLITAVRMAELKDPERAIVFWCAYLVTRREDDAIDLDRPIPGDVDEYIRRHQSIVRQEIDPSADNYEQMLAFSVLRLESVQGSGDNVRESFVNMTEAMLVDKRRSQFPEFLTEDDLGKYYYGTFTHALNLSLIAAGSSMRADDLPEMVYTQGSLLSIRDLEKDWSPPRNLYNVPAEVLAIAGIDMAWEAGRVRRPPVIREWAVEEKRKGRKGIRELSARIRKNGDDGARLLCLLPIIGMNVIARWPEPRR